MNPSELDTKITDVTKRRELILPYSGPMWVETPLSAGEKVGSSPRSSIVFVNTVAAGDRRLIGLRAQESFDILSDHRALECSSLKYTVTDFYCRKGGPRVT